MGKKTTSSQTTTNQNAVDVLHNAQSTLPTAYSTFNPSQASQYLNPYASSYIGAQGAVNTQQGQLAANAASDQAYRSGVGGGSRVRIAQLLASSPYDLAQKMAAGQALSGSYNQALQTGQAENTAANQFPLSYAQLMGQLAQGTQTNTTQTDKQSGVGNAIDSFSDYLRAVSGSANSNH